MARVSRGNRGNEEEFVKSVHVETTQKLYCLGFVVSIQRLFTNHEIEIMKGPFSLYSFHLFIYPFSLHSCPKHIISFELGVTIPC